ncbi:MAG: sigma-70 family RNA polymerase sigma factor [Gammaproteobacteria bacterium]
MNPADRERHWMALMEQSLAGDSTAYHELLVLLTAALRSAIRGRARSVGVDVEDIVQETLLALHLKRATWSSGTPVAPWVAAIARNKLIDVLRRRGHRTQVSLESVVDTLWSDDDDSGAGALDVQLLLGELTERQREVVQSVSLEGYSARETAARLCMTEGSVRVTLHRSLKILAATFGKVRDEN